MIRAVLFDLDGTLLDRRQSLDNLFAINIIASPFI